MRASSASAPLRAASRLVDVVAAAAEAEEQRRPVLQQRGRPRPAERGRPSRPARRAPPAARGVRPAGRRGRTVPRRGRSAGRTGRRDPGRPARSAVPSTAAWRARAGAARVRQAWASTAWAPAVHGESCHPCAAAAVIAASAAAAARRWSPATSGGRADEAEALDLEQPEVLVAGHAPGRPPGPRGPPPASVGPSAVDARRCWAAPRPAKASAARAGSSGTAVSSGAGPSSPASRCGRRPEVVEVSVVRRRRHAGCPRATSASPPRPVAVPEVDLRRHERQPGVGRWRGRPPPRARARRSSVCSPRATSSGAHRCRSVVSKRAVACLGGVPQRFDRSVLSCPPGGRLPVQLRRRRRAVAVEVGGQVGAHQLLDAELRPVRPGRHDETGRALEGAEHVGGVGAAGQLRGQRGRDGVADARPAEEVAFLLRDVGEHLAGEVVGHRALVAGEGGEEVVGGGVVAQRQGGEPDPRGPPVGARMEVGGLPSGEVQAAEFREGRGLLGREASCAVRSSHSRSSRRSRATGSAGSNRLASTSRTVLRRWRSRSWRPCRVSGLRRWCASSSTSATRTGRRRERLQQVGEEVDAHRRAGHDEAAQAARRRHCRAGRERLRGPTSTAGGGRRPPRRARPRRRARPAGGPSRRAGASCRSRAAQTRVRRGPRPGPGREERGRGTNSGGRPGTAVLDRDTCVTAEAPALSPP